MGLGMSPDWYRHGPVEGVRWDTRASSSREGGAAGWDKLLTEVVAPVAIVMASVGRVKTWVDTDLPQKAM